jgi:hypothetical protein
MHRDGEICGLIGQDLVDHFNVALGHPIDVNAACGVGSPLFDRAEFTPARVVKLQIAAAAFIKRKHGVRPRLCKIVKKRIGMLSIKRDGLIGLTAHRTDEVQHRGRRDRVFDGCVAGNRLQTVIGF